MGIFNNIKELFKRENKVVKINEENKNNIDEKEFSLKEKEEVKEEKTIELYEKGLSKTRNNFVDKLINLNSKTKKITEEYFEELEDILIMADIGVNTVLSFIERLKKRVKSENITDMKYLQEVIVDELFIIYVDNSILTNERILSKVF